MKQRNSGEGIDRRAIRELNRTLDELLAELVVVRHWPEFSTSYRAISTLHENLIKHERWRAHLRFYDLFEILGLFIERYKAVGPDDGSGIRLVTAIEPARFKCFRQDVVAFLLSLPREYSVFVELPSMPRWGAGEMQITKRLTIVERESKGVSIAEIGRGIGLGYDPCLQYVRGLKLMAMERGGLVRPQ